jgi:hypothetical protein
MSQSKNKRQIEVYRAIDKFKRAKPHQIVQHVTSIMGEDSESAAFKRAIHRDLKSLTQDNILGVEYFTPSGEPIHPDDEDNHANLRVEYFLLAADGQNVTGQELLKAIGAEIMGTPSLMESTHIEENLNNIDANKYIISMEIHLAKFIHIIVDAEERPFTVQFARTTKKLESHAYRQALLDGLSGRSLILLVPQGTVSRMKLEPSLGHASVQFTKEHCAVRLNDHGSSLGTEYKVVSEHEVDEMLHDHQDKTISTPTVVGTWKRLKQPTDEELPLAIKLGDAKIVVSNS